MMKKVLLLAVAAMMATSTVSAQDVKDLKNEIGVSYGLGLSTLGDGIGTGFAEALFSGLSKTEHDRSSFGSLSVEYLRHVVTPRLAVGGIFSYSRMDDDILDKDNNRAKIGEGTRSYYSVMPAVKWYWVNSNYIGLYSKGAAGIMIMHSSNKDLQDASRNESDSKLYFAGQLSVLGLEFGGLHFRGFVEAGVGEQGIFLAGLRAKF